MTIKQIQKFGDLLGETIVYATGKRDDGEINITLADARKFVLFHDQGCCEVVTVEDVVGDWGDLYGSPLTVAEEVVYANEDPPGVAHPGEDSFTWTFYRLGTSRGVVTIRWYGESNGYYSESVDFEEVVK